MPLSTRRAAAVLVAGALVLGSAACATDDSSSGGKAADKKITVYSGRSEKLVQPLLDKFTQRSGIKVETRYASTAQLAAQLTEEGDKSPADAFFAQDAGALGAVGKRNMFAPLPAETAEKVPANYRAKDGQWIGITARSRVLAYNTELVPATQLPKSVFELTDPRWKGKVGVAPTNASFEAFVTAMRVQHGDARTREFLTKLAANDPQIRDNNVKIVEDVDAGRVAVGLVNHYYLGELAAERGVKPEALKAKLHFFPGGDTGALVNVAGIGMLKRAAQDPDVTAFIDYLLSPEAQTYFAEQTFEYPVVAGVPAPAGVPPLSQLTVPPVDLNDIGGLDAAIALIKESGLLP